MVGTKHCCYGICKNDSRYADRPGMEGVFFIPFPKPITKKEKCEKWVRACGRLEEDFNPSKINRSTYICSKHFVGGNGPTAAHPDPIPAAACSEQVEKFSKRKRKSPKKRLPPIAKKARVEAAEALLDLRFTEPLPPSPSQAAATNVMGQTCPQGYSTLPSTSSVCECGRNKLMSTRDVACQTVYDKYILGAKIETMVMQNQLALKQNGKDQEPPIPVIAFDNTKDDEK